MANSAVARSRQAAVVYNPTKVDLAKLESAAMDAAAKAGWATPLWFPTSADDAGQNATRIALEQRVDLVIAVGGDGTVRAVTEVLRSADVPLAIVPAGTANLFARNLGLPIGDLAASARIAFSKVERAIDVGVVTIVRNSAEPDEEHAFVVMAGLGIDARMVKNTSKSMKRAVGWLAYVGGITRSLPQMRALRLRYRLDDAPEQSLSAHSLIVGNCGGLTGGFLLMPDAHPDDGILDIAALRPRGPFGWLNVWNRVAWQNRVVAKNGIGRRIIELGPDMPDVTYLTGRTLHVRFERPEYFQLDGDVFGEAISIFAWVDPGALRVKMPDES